MFGDFFYNCNRIDYSELQYKENGTPIVAQWGNNMFQFGIYGNKNIICQRCTRRRSIISFSIEQYSTKRFCYGADFLYEYTPRFDFEKSNAYDNASYYYDICRNKIDIAELNLLSVYGDDFTLICMVGIEAFLNAFHNSRMGLHYKHKFNIAKRAPAEHHLLAIEEGHVIHFSRGNGNGTPRIIREKLEDVVKRASDRWGSSLVQVEYKNDNVINRLLARNRALMVFAGLIPFGDYNLLTNNCEHFVNWCKTGKTDSEQVTNFFIDAASILTSIIFRNPAPLMTRIAQRRLRIN